MLNVLFFINGGVIMKQRRFIYPMLLFLTCLFSVKVNAQEIVKKNIFNLEEPT